MHRHKLGVFATVAFLAIAAIGLLGVLEALGYSLPDGKRMAAFLPDPPKGWSPLPDSLDIYSSQEEIMVGQDYQDPSGRMVYVIISASLLSPDEENYATEEEEDPCRYEDKEYNVQGFRVYDTLWICPEDSGHALNVFPVETKEFELWVHIEEHGVTKDDGTLRAMLESMDLKGLRSLVE